MITKIHLGTLILSVLKQEIIYLTLKTFGQAFNMNTEFR